MKVSSAYSQFTALALKTVGLVMIISSLLDYIMLAIPAPGVDLKDPELWRQWQFQVTGQIIEQGIIPLVGIAFLLAGYWISSSMNSLPTERQPSWQDLRVWALWLSSLLGLIFLLLVPLHLTNTLWVRDQGFKTIEREATQAETQLESQTQQLDALVNNPEQIAQVEQRLQQLEQAIESGQIPEEQQAQARAQLQAGRQQLQLLKDNPEAITEEVEANLNQLRSRKIEAENRINNQFWKSGVKTAIGSLLLAIGYSVIGWMGLRKLGEAKANH